MIDKPVHPLELTGLSPLMARGFGSMKIVIGLIDGPVSSDHPDLVRAGLRSVPGRRSCCKNTDSMSCRHGTFIAGILKARRNSPAPAICPGCTLLIRPVFSEIDRAGAPPAATPVELAWAILDCIEEGARIVNLSIAIEEPSAEGDRELQHALDRAARNNVLVVAAAGNQGIIGGSVLTRHPWVIPVSACNLRGIPAAYSNRTASLCRRGLRAPGEKVTSLGSQGPPIRLGGTSTAVPFVTGALALLWSSFPHLNADDLKSSIAGPLHRQQRLPMPPLLDAWKAFRTLDSRSAKLRRPAA